MKLIYIIVAALVSIVICYVYLNRTYSNETYNIDSPYNLIIVDENGNMSTVSIHPPAINEAHIPPSTNITYVDRDGNLGVIAYGNMGGSNRNILTVDANNNFSVLTPPTAPSISIVSIRQASNINPTCVIRFSVLTEPNLYPVTNYTFQFNNSNLTSPVITNPETPNNVPKIFEQSLYLLNYPTLPNSLTSTFSFKIKAINAIGTSPSAQVSSVLNIPKSK